LLAAAGPWVRLMLCGLLSRKGIVEWTGDTALKEAFSEYDRNLLVSDHRQKEKKKFGGLGARSKYQKSYR